MWGTAEALSARAEAHERLGDYRRAAVDYVGAMEHAERIGARAQRRSSAPGWAACCWRRATGSSGERLLREVIDGPAHGGNEAVPAARLFLAGRLGPTAAASPRAANNSGCCARASTSAHFVVFDAFILGAEAWLEAVDGRYEAGPAGHPLRRWPGDRPAVRRPSPRTCAPSICPSPRPPSPAWTAARTRRRPLLGAADRPAAAAARPRAPGARGA